jgi:hypothetical protein
MYWFGERVSSICSCEALFNCHFSSFDSALNEISPDVSCINVRLPPYLDLLDICLENRLSNNESGA